MAYIGTVDDLQRQALRKDLAAGSSESPESAEAQLLVMLDDCRAAYEAALQKLANVRSKFVAGMSEQSKAALTAMGNDVQKDLSTIENVNLALQKRLNDARRERARGIAKRGRNVAAEDLRILREHSAAVVRGAVPLGERDRRRLARALSIAEMEVQASA